MVTQFTPLAGLGGGMLIGVSAVLLMGGIGRIAGISGLFGALIGGAPAGGKGWRLLFLVGLLGGTLSTALLGGVDQNGLAFPGNPLTTLLGGLLVGAGTAMAAGCTSGHGICGLARLSRRSLVATPAVFMGTAILTVFIIRHVIGD